MELRNEELYRLLKKKDEMILDLTSRLRAYEDRFGPLKDTTGTRKHCESDENTLSDVSVKSDGKKALDAKTQSNSLKNASNFPEKQSIRGGHNVILDYSDDSPIFRRQLEGFEPSVSGLRALLKEIGQATKDYVASGLRFGETEAAIANEITHRKHSRAIFTTCYPEFGTLSSIFNEFHEIITQMHSSRVSFLFSIESLLLHGTEEFGEKEIRDITDLRKEMVRLGDEYEGLLGKFLSKSRPGTSSNTIEIPSNLPMTFIDTEHSFPVGPPSLLVHTNSASNSIGDRIPTTPSNLKALEKDVCQARMRFELSRFDLVWCLNRMESQKKLFLIEAFNSSLYAFFAHIQACHEFIRSQEPKARQRQEMLQNAKETFAQDEKMWLQQREKLETQLRSDCNEIRFEDSRSRLSPPAVHSASSTDNLSIWIRGLRPSIQVLSSQTMENRNGNGVNSGIQQGYLFIRTSSFPVRSWKRKWFEIHAGKLYQSRGSHMDFVLVCDLMLSKVRECSSLHLPFCLEVLDANQNKTILQATSEFEMMEWIQAAQRITESMLEKQSHRMKVHPEQQQYVQEILMQNASCADCGHTTADWVSINIGVLLCIECSGIHRSLGVHISKIRSLTLDSWELALLQLLRNHLGNAVVNSVLEAVIPSGWTKPLPLISSREEKTKWIHAKYLLHAFIDRDIKADQAKIDFLQAARNGEILGLVRGLAHGVDINVCDEEKRTALKLTARTNATWCCEYLLLNGAIPA
uniref:Uncharacterized protein AlNc14C4G535 n=1 Tax=Albugo laibachii Nc14 TaxID=890382 RepID=F0W093_9STRA|nr:conserved hypothetical protein [Albugo laibachii Nc14]|eukprot:CCA14464.1 conserved hypothetical protein [Albugo laibachii Nc14]